MVAVKDQIAMAVEWLQGSVPERQYQAAMLIRIAVTDSANKDIVQKAGAVRPLVDALHFGSTHPVTMVAIEALACLVTQHAESREEFRMADGHDRLVELISEAPESDLAHRILLTFQVLADKEADRKSLLQAGISGAIKPFLSNSQGIEYVEHALSAVCNLAAGSQSVKQQIGDAGLVEPLIELLTASYDRSLSQLAALALRNLSRNPSCRQEILRLDGVTALLEFLSEGVEDLQYPLHCEAHYDTPKGAISRPAMMAVDTERGQLIVSAEQKAACFCMSKPEAPTGSGLHKDSTAERYSLMMKAMRFSKPTEHQLDILFNVDGKGVLRLGNKDKKAIEINLTKVVIEECDAYELSELVTKLLNRLYTQQEFKVAGGAAAGTMFNSKFLASSQIGTSDGITPLSPPFKPSSPPVKPAMNAHPISLEGVAPTVLK